MIHHSDFASRYFLLMPIYGRHFEPGQLQFITTSTYRRSRTLPCNEGNGDGCGRRNILVKLAQRYVKFPSNPRN